mgnify:CR=1 FL=1
MMNIPVIPVATIKNANRSIEMVDNKDVKDLLFYERKNICPNHGGRKGKIRFSGGLYF